MRRTEGTPKHLTRAKPGAVIGPDQLPPTPAEMFEAGLITSTEHHQAIEMMERLDAGQHDPGQPGLLTLIHSRRDPSFRRAVCERERRASRPMTSGSRGARNRSPRDSSPRRRGSRRNSPSADDDPGGGDADPPAVAERPSDVDIAERVERRPCIECGRLKCKDGERTCAKCRKDKERDRRREAKRKVEEAKAAKTPAGRKGCECDLRIVALEDPSRAELVCLTCGVAREDLGRVNGWDAKVALLKNSRWAARPKFRGRLAA